MSALPPLVIVSGPSGSGKSTVISQVLATADLPVHLSVSATTRRPRPGERDGVHYYFWTRERFEKELEAGEFLEWAQVHGAYYGTLRREVEPYRQQEQVVLLDIDTQGAAQVRRQYPDCVTVFLRTSSLDAYEERLRRRGTEDEAAIARRLAAARRELAQAELYEFQVINDDLPTAVARLTEIIRGRLRSTEHAG
jgi:guanylate kinase